MVAQGLSKSLNQSVVVDNKAGQGGSVGSAELAKSKPDGYTLGGGTISSHALNVSLYPKLAYDPIKDFAPITLLAALPNVLVVHPSLNVKSVPELIALLKANPDKYFWFSGQWHITAYFWRDVQTGNRYANAACSLPRQWPHDGRFVGQYDSD
jgi:tripartite-type tricarboxylate transporter receptor subunit TctC